MVLWFQFDRKPRAGAYVAGLHMFYIWQLICSK
jgi:hypothetical protein